MTNSAKHNVLFSPFVTFFPILEGTFITSSMDVLSGNDSY